MNGKRETERQKEEKIKPAWQPVWGETERPWGRPKKKKAAGKQWPEGGTE